MPGPPPAAAAGVPAKKERREVVDIDFADPQTVRLNSPLGAAAPKDDPAVLAARLRDAHRLRAEQSVGGRQQSAAPRAVPGGSWRVQDFGEQGGEASALAELAGHLQGSWVQRTGHGAPANKASGADSSPLRFPVRMRLARPSSNAPRGSLSARSISPDRRRPPRSPDRLRPPRGSQSVVPLTSRSRKRSTSPDRQPQPHPGDKPQRPLSARAPSTTAHKPQRPLSARAPSSTTAYMSPYNSLRPNSQRMPQRRPSTAGHRSSESRDALFADHHRPCSKQFAPLQREGAIPRGMASAPPPGVKLERRKATRLERCPSDGAEDPDTGETGNTQANPVLDHGSFKVMRDSGAEDLGARQLIKKSWAYAMAGRFDAALRCAEEACTIEEDNAEVHLRIAKAYQGLKKWSKADQAIKRGQEFSPDDQNLELCYLEIKLPLLKERGLQLMQASEPDEAIAAFSEALTSTDLSDDDKYWLLIHRCRVYMSKLDMVSGADDASQCIRLRPSAVEAYERYCDSVVALGDLDAARQGAQIGLMHSVNHHNEVLANILDRIAQGTMPKVSAPRVFVKQLMKQDEDVNEVPRLLRVWDKRLKKDVYNKVLEYWKKQLQSLMPQKNSDEDTPTTTAANSVAGSHKPLAAHLTRSLSYSSMKSMDFSRSQSCATSVFSNDDLKDNVNKVVYICKECFKFISAKNKELFLRMAVDGWSAMGSVLTEDNSLAMAALNLQMGYAYLQACEFVQTQQGFTEERECIKCFERAIEQLQDNEFDVQRAGAWFGLAKAYKGRREGDHIENLLKSASYLRNFLTVCSFKLDPHRCIAAHHEIGDLYIEAGQIDLANQFLLAALDYLKGSESTGWNSLAGIKFLRAQTHCKLAEACEKANSNLDPDEDPLHQRNVQQGIEHYEVPAQ